MFVKICWALTAAFAAFNLLSFASDLNNAESAPQQAAAAAMAMAWVVMPYVLTRSFEALFASKSVAAPTSVPARNTPARDIAEGQH